jgi:hypothetical protein
VFTTELGEPCDPRNALRALKAAAKRANLPSTVGLRTLRHSAASVMLSAGVPLKVVSEVFGHASVAFTGDVYGHVSPDVLREALPGLATPSREKGGQKRWSTGQDDHEIRISREINLLSDQVLHSVGLARFELATP